MVRKAADKLARQRLSVLELAQALGGVSEPCRRRGISRQSSYEYKYRFEKHGVEGLGSGDLPPIHASHPMTTPEEQVERLLAISLEHPARGSVFLSDRLRLQGIAISAPTVQNILNKHELRTRYDRWLRLECFEEWSSTA